MQSWLVYYFGFERFERGKLELVKGIVLVVRPNGLDYIFQVGLLFFFFFFFGVLKINRRDKERTRGKKLEKKMGFPLYVCANNMRELKTTAMSASCFEPRALYIEP